MSDYTEYSVKIRDEDDVAAVQINGKNATCKEGNVMCAFQRAYDWVVNGERHDADVCFADTETASWRIQGIVGNHVLEPLPDETRDLVDATMFAVFRDGNEVLLKPSNEVDP
jgi:hypothetical protein